MTTVFSLLQYHTKLFKLETSYKSPIRNYSSPLDLLFFQNKIIYAHRISKLLNPKLFMLKGASESAKRIDLRFQELRFVRFKKNNAFRSSRNRFFIKICAFRNSWKRYSNCFAQKGAPETDILFVLHKKELLKPFFNLFWTKRSSWNWYSEWFALSGAPFIIKQNVLHKKERRKPIFTSDLYFQEFLKPIFDFDLHFQEFLKLIFIFFHLLSNSFETAKESFLPLYYAFETRREISSCIYFDNYSWALISSIC